MPRFRVQYFTTEEVTYTVSVDAEDNEAAHEIADRDYHKLIRQAERTVASGQILNLGVWDDSSPIQPNQPNNDCGDPLDLPDQIERGAFDDLLVNLETACRNRRSQMEQDGLDIPWDN